MRPCPSCEKMQPDLAPTCSNCGQALAPPTGAVPLDPVLELRATLQQRDQELAAATARIADVQRQAAVRESELQQQADALAAENDSFRANADEADLVAPAWGSAALVRLLRKWPRSSTAGAALLAAGTVFGGWELGRRLLSDDTAGQGPAGLTAVGGTDATAVIKERDDLSAQMSVAVKDREQLTTQLAAAVKERDEIRGQMTGAVQERDALRTQVAGLESQLGTAHKDLAAANAARDQALAREKTALARGGGGDRPLARAGVSAGFVDFIVPSGRDESDIVLQRGQAPVLAGGGWPSGECTVVAGDPEARFSGVGFEVVGPRKRSRTTVLNSPCNATTIIVKKAPQWDGGDVVRLFWQLK